MQHGPVVVGVHFGPSWPSCHDQYCRSRALPGMGLIAQMPGEFGPQSLFPDPFRQACKQPMLPEEVFRRITARQ